MAEQPWDEFLDEDDDAYDWVAPGLLERADRVILTGPEGGGKSTLLRQIAWRLACGLHPFKDIQIPPRRVLLLDFENSRKQVRRKLRPFSDLAKPVSTTHLYIEVRPEGLDLHRELDRIYLLTMLVRHQPDLVLAGPVYKMSDGDRFGEEKALALARWWDEMRTKLGFALVFEEHSPHSGSDHEVLRPYGASLWKRWPEFGFHLSDKGRITHWRGPRDERDWPAELHRGGAWPWMSTTTAVERDWALIVGACTQAAQRPTHRDIEGATGLNQNAINRVIGPKGPYRDEWKAMWP